MQQKSETLREEAVWLMRRNGAWLIYAAGSVAEDATDIERFDAARSLATAKRVARRMAIDFDYHGPFRWTQEENGGWRLEASYVNTWDDYSDEYEEPDE